MFYLDHDERKVLMKRTLSILLILLLVLSILPTAAFAEGPAVVLSPQNLRVNGAKINCEKYNIDGSNYFKLRDIALVLSGTGSEFSVNWDGEKKCISIVTGEAYEPNGSELDLSGGDKSDTAVPSTDTILINGEARSDLSAYKLGGNNFYKLRDLGDALGFAVDYDKESNTAIVISKAYSWVTPWRIDEYYEKNNSGWLDHSVTTYDENGRALSSWNENGDYWERTDYFYNDLGYRVGESFEYSSNYGDEQYEHHSYTTAYYDKWGQLEKEITVSSGTGSSGEEVREVTYTYDENGRLLRHEDLSPYNHTLVENTYDQRGYMVRSTYSYSDMVSYTTEYVRDEEGNILQEKCINADGTERYSYEYTYENGRTSTEIYVNGDYRSVSTYTYDDNGNLLVRSTDSNDWDSESRYTYNEEGRQTSYTYYNGADLFTTTYTYDEEGRRLHTEYSSPDGDYVTDYTYDEEGRPLSENYVGTDFTRLTAYSYDLAEMKRTQTVTTTFPAATELVISSTELNLAVGDEDFLYFYFLPYNCAAETVTWSSSDESVAVIDEKGNLTACGAGVAVITAISENGLTASCTVTVIAQKHFLAVQPDQLTVGAGKTGTLLCQVAVVGSWQPCQLHWDNSDSSVLSLEWGDWHENDTEIDLFVTGLKPGKADVRITQRNPDDENEVYNVLIVSVTVTADESTAEKP